MDYQKAGIHFNGKSWCHNIKLLSDDGKIKYSKRAGFQTSEEALQSAVSYEERFKEDLRKFHLKNKIDFDITLKDYLIYWYNEIYSSRVEATARMLGQYTLYYLIFLFNTVSSYFVAYKYSLVNAEQKNYIQTNIITVTKMITVMLQIIVILTTGNFYAYLLTAATVELLQKIFVSRYLNNMYPYLKEKDIKPLTKEEVGEVVKKTKALVLHKVGDVARLQTDAMIISGFINVTLSGIVDNYNLVISSVSNFVNIIFNSVLSSFGNLIATESRQKQYEIFKVYRFFACWIYGFSATGFLLLLTPLVWLWLGPSNVLPVAAVTCILIDYYFKGERIVLSNFKQRRICIILLL